MDCFCSFGESFAFAFVGEPVGYYGSDLGVHVFARLFDGGGLGEFDFGGMWFEEIVVCFGNEMECMSSSENVGPVSCICDGDDLSSVYSSNRTRWDQGRT